MALGVRMKRSDNKRPKFSGGRSGEKRRAEPFARRKQHGSRDNSEGQNRRRGQDTVAKTNTKRSFLDEDDSDTHEGERGRTRVLRGPSVKRVAGLGSKRMGSRKPVEPSAGKFKPRGSSAAGDTSRDNLRFRGNEKRKEETNTKRSFLDEDDSDTYEGERGRTRVLRGPSVKRVAGLGSKRIGLRKPVEPSAGKFKPRGSSAAGDSSRDNLRFRGNEKRKEERNATDAKVHDDGASEKSAEEDKDDKADPAVRQRRVRVQSRVLDKTGKKVRVNRKALSERQGSGDTLSRPNKKKRVIKIDPYDTSNKRLDDSITVHNEKVVEEKAEISKNAQFRAIQPSPAILSFVEDNLLGRRRLVELQNAGYNVKLSAPLDNVAFSTSTDREGIEENVFRNKLDFFAAAKIQSSFPAPLIPEIAFAGRSNVGKSSLLNALTRQWGVARTSDRPGLTQTINFFRLASKLCLVDLPGYGFAYAKDEVKESWEELVKEYVSTRVGLQRVCLLIDTKWGMKPRDHELVELMERSQTPYQIVLTKTDLVFPIDVARRAMKIQEDLKSNKSAVNPVMMISSKSGGGIRNLRTVLAKLARFVKP